MWPGKKWTYYELVLLCCSCGAFCRQTGAWWRGPRESSDPLCLYGLGKENAGTSVKAREVFFFECKHTLTPCCYCRVFSGTGDSMDRGQGQGTWDRDMGQGQQRGLQLWSGQGTTLTHLRAQLYRQTGESPREIVHFCCLLQNTRSLCISDHQYQEWNPCWFFPCLLWHQCRESIEILTIFQSMKTFVMRNRNSVCTQRHKKTHTIFSP